MKIRFIRHGDPDYGNDTLTEKGRKEAQLLAKTAHSPPLVPTSATKVVTEEREQGIAYFRGIRLGDSSYLYAGNQEPSFACRFASCLEIKNRDINEKTS